MKKLNASHGSLLSRSKNMNGGSKTLELADGPLGKASGYHG